MQISVRRVARRYAALVIGAAVAAAGLMVPSASSAPVAAAEPQFTVTYPVTYEHLLGVPTGTHLAIFADRLVSDESFRPFDPWTITAPDGLEVWASCARYDVLSRLPITFVGKYGPAGQQKTQINVYLPNEPGPEPWGDCQNVGTTRFQIHPARDHGPMLERDIRTLPAHPGLTKRPRYRNPGNGALVEQSVCEGNPALCPVMIGVKRAQLQLDLAGADHLVDCPTCPWGVSLTPVGGGTETFLKVISLDRTAVLGQETAIVEVVSPIGPGKYQIKVGSIFGAFAAQDHNVTFG